MAFLPCFLSVLRCRQLIVGAVRLVCTIGLLALFTGIGPSQAQPALGALHREVLPLSGGSIPLPQGVWQVTLVTTQTRPSVKWEILVLKNTAADALIPYLVVRNTTHRVRWGDTACVTDTANPFQFLVNVHGSSSSSLVGKCSRVFQLGNVTHWVNNTAPASDWWKDLIPGFGGFPAHANKSMLLAEMRVQAHNGRGLDMAAFIVPPRDAASARFREDARAGRLSPDHELLKNWVAIYVEAAETAFFNNRPATIFALQFQGSDRATTAVVPPAVAPNSPSLTGPGLAAVPAAAPVSQPSPQGASKERLAADQERQNLMQQLDKMREMLAQLQQANAAAAAQAQRAQAPAPAAPQKGPMVFAQRKALVIGNDQYTDVPALSNAVADAEAMARSLESVGYKVWKHLNLNEKRFKQALREFRQQVDGGDEVLVFYAGHGVQLGNSNYLLPVDIKGDHEDQIKDEAIQLQRVLDDLKDRQTKFALAVIDACRDNPFKGNGRAIGGRGLAPTTAATGQMIIFSAGSGQQALDKLGKDDTDKNGLFTRVFLREMVKPGVSVDRVLRNVRNEVVKLAKSVGHEQTPALYDQAIGEFYFRQ